MNIQGFFSAAYTTTANAASSVYGFGKDILGKGCSVCSSLADKVKLVAGRLIPTAISNTVQAYPKSFSFAAGAGVAVAVSIIASRFFFQGDGPIPPVDNPFEGGSTEKTQE